MSLFRKRDCDGKFPAHIPHNRLWCDKPDRIPAEKEKKNVSFEIYNHTIYFSVMKKKLTVDASILPPNQTAYRCM